MNRCTLSTIGRISAVITTVLAVYQSALAGPALVCWPFDIGAERSLPFVGPEWGAIQPDYARHHLVADTLQLLARESPVIVRMETLRRATVYAMKDPQVARELLGRLGARANASVSQRVMDALAALDFGYSIECFRQAQWAMKDSSLVAGLDGYAWISKALQIRGKDPQMEFAAALVAVDRTDRNAFAGHLQRALAGATEDSLLGRNLVRQGHLLRLKGHSLSELKPDAGAARSALPMGGYVAGGTFGALIAFAGIAYRRRKSRGSR